jgi:hypothetical protein
MAMPRPTLVRSSDPDHGHVNVWRPIDEWVGSNTARTVAEGLEHSIGDDNRWKPPTGDDNAHHREAGLCGTVSEPVRAYLRNSSEVRQLRFSSKAKCWFQAGEKRLGGLKKSDLTKEFMLRLTAAAEAERCWYHKVADLEAKVAELQKENADPAKRRRQANGFALATVAAGVAVGTISSVAQGDIHHRILSEIGDLGDLAYFLLDYTGGWVLCPQELECWDSKSMALGLLFILCSVSLFLFLLVCIIGVDRDEKHGEERRRRCCGRLPSQALCSLCDKLEMTCGGNAALAVFYLLLFGGFATVQVFGFGYDAMLVLLYDVGCVLALGFVAGLLRLFFPQLYKK